MVGYLGSCSPTIYLDNSDHHRRGVAHAWGWGRVQLLRYVTTTWRVTDPLEYSYQTSPEFRPLRHLEEQSDRSCVCIWLWFPIPLFGRGVIMVPDVKEAGGGVTRISPPYPLVLCLVAPVNNTARLTPSSNLYLPSPIIIMLTLSSLH